MPLTGEYIVGSLKRDESTTVKVRLRPYGGSNQLDIRQFWLPDGADWTPTKKGVFVDVKQLPALVDLLQQAVAHSVAIGILTKAEAGKANASNQRRPKK